MSEQPGPSGFEHVGCAVGKGFKACKKLLSRPEGLADKVNGGTSKVASRYENCTGRDARSDGRVLGIVAAATGAVIVASAVVSVASHALVATAVCAGGVMGAAAYCKHNGHEKEYASIVSGATTAGTALQQAGKDFMKGWSSSTGADGVDAAAAVPSGQSASVVVDGVPVPDGYYANAPANGFDAAQHSSQAASAPPAKWSGKDSLI